MTFNDYGECGRSGNRGKLARNKGRGAVTLAQRRAEPGVFLPVGGLGFGGRLGVIGESTP
jgi:hypothetical protein